MHKYNGTWTTDGPSTSVPNTGKWAGFEANDTTTGSQCLCAVYHNQTVIPENLYFAALKSKWGKFY